MRPATISRGEPDFPEGLVARLSEKTPAKLTYTGNVGLLLEKKSALFCSARCPGHVILTVYDQAVQWRDTGRCIISGFHSPVEKECLNILLRGTSPIIICPARSLPKRIPNAWQKSLEEGRMLILSGFSDSEDRITSDLAQRRNEIVAALADAVLFAHISPGGQAARLAAKVSHWGVPVSVVSGNRP